MYNNIRGYTVHIQSDLSNTLVPSFTFNNEFIQIPFFEIFKHILSVHIVVRLIYYDIECVDINIRISDVNPPPILIKIISFKYYVKQNYCHFIQNLLKRIVNLSKSVNIILLQLMSLHVGRIRNLNFMIYLLPIDHNIIL